MNNVLIKHAIDYIFHCFSAGDVAGGHDSAHTMRVYHNALRIAETIDGCDIQTISLAALLHDVDDRKVSPSTHETLGNARKFMSNENISEDIVTKVCNIINKISFSGGKIPDSIEGKIVQDADRLDAIGAIGIARAFAYGGHAGRPMTETINHFHEKLLHLKDLMNTPEGLRLAEERHNYMVDFLECWKKES